MKVVQVFKKEMLAPRYLVVETSDRQRAVNHEEECDDKKHQGGLVLH